MTTQSSKQKVDTPKEIRVIDVAGVVPWKLVKKAMEFLHPTHGKRGEKVYMNLLKQIAAYPRTRTPKKKEYLKVHAGGGRWVIDRPDFHKDQTNEEMLEDDYISVSIIKEGDPQHWGLSFNPWKKLSNLIVEEETLNRYPLAMIMAEFMWEITWYGPEEKALKIGRDVIKRARQIKNDLAKRKKKQT